MARRPDLDDAYTKAELEELRNSLARLSGPSVTDFYRDAYRSVPPRKNLDQKRCSA